MTLDDLVPPRVTASVAAHGLHKVAGAMLGQPELTLPVALRSLGEMSYRRRKEARAIADGVAALGVVTGTPANIEKLSRVVVPVR